MIYIFDRNENLLEILTEYENRESTTKLNSERTLSFSCKKSDHIKKYNKAGYFENDKFQLFIIDDPVSFKDLEEDKITVECIHDFYSLSDSIIDDKRAKTINEALTKTLENSNYKVGVVESFENRDINFYHTSRLKALNEIIKAYKCEFDVRIEIDLTSGRISNKYVDLKHRLGSDTGLRFTYDTALESVEKSVITEGHFNVLWGWGKSLETENGGYSRKLDFADINNNKKYVEDIESIEKYGRLEGIFEDSSIEDKTILLKATRERLEVTKDLKLSYKATVKDISKLVGFEHFKVGLGDTIIILDEEINEIIEARIIEITENENETILTLGNFQLALSDEDLEDVLGDLNDKIDNIPKPELPTIDTIYPDTLPSIPTVEAKGLFSSVILTWTYENKNYYTYEVFASQLKDFYPSVDNRIFEGKASSFLHEVKPSETWYYRVRGKNTYDKVTDYSLQVEATTKKISDGTQYFEELAIGHALIASLDLDKATVGKLKAQFLDVYNLVVRDGNGKITLKVDDFGRIYMDVTELKINAKNVLNENQIDSKIEIANNAINLEIKKKVNEKEIISAINMSSEEIKIAAARLTLTGYLTINSLTDGTTTISGSNIKTGTIRAVDIEGCDIRGTRNLYMSAGGTMACDGNTYIRNLFIPGTHPAWEGGGSFRVVPTAYFDNDVWATGEVFSRQKGVINREDGVFVQVDALGVQAGTPNNYLLIKGYQSPHNFGVDLWYSDANLKENINVINTNTRPISNKKIGLDLINSINHYNFNYKENGGHVDCGYIAQDLQKNNSDLVREVVQNDESIVLEPVTSMLIPSLSLAIKQQQEQIKVKDKKILDLENRIKIIEEKLELILN